MLPDIDMVILEADMEVICSLSDYYYKQGVIYENADGEIHMEGFSLKSIKEAGKKLWQMFIKALQTLQRWFHKKTKFVFMKKRMQKATPREMKKFQKALDKIDECLNDIDELFANEMYDMLEPTNSHGLLNLSNFNDRLECIVNNHAYRFALTNDDEKLVEKAHHHVITF